MNLRLPHIGSLVLLLFFFARSASASVQGLDLMPDVNAYFSCVAATCVDKDLKSQAIADAQSRGVGTWTYLLSNMATGHMWAIQVQYEGDPGYGEPYVTTTSPYAVPSVYIDGFSGVVGIARAQGGPLSFNIPASVTPGLPNDIAGMADVSSYLSQQNVFQNPILVMSRPIVSVTFSDGTTAQFMLTGPYEDSGGRFSYIAGTHKDSSGHPIPDNSNLGNNMGYSMGASYKGTTADLVVYGTVVIDWQSGIVTVGPITSCDDQGHCVTY